MADERLDATEWRERALKLKGDGWLLSDLAGVDALDLPDSDRRFRIAVQLLHLESKTRTAVQIEAIGDPPTIPSISDVWPTANFMEREAFDLFGIVFDGHPNLTRILMPDEWEGYPLRKDYGVGKVQVEFRPEPLVQIERPPRERGGLGHTAGSEPGGLGPTAGGEGGRLGAGPAAPGSAGDGQ